MSEYRIQKSYYLKVCFFVLFCFNIVIRNVHAFYFLLRLLLAQHQQAVLSLKHSKLNPRKSFVHSFFFLFVLIYGRRRIKDLQNSKSITSFRREKLPFLCQLHSRRRHAFVLFSAVVLSSAQIVCFVKVYQLVNLPYLNNLSLLVTNCVVSFAF